MPAIPPEIPALAKTMSIPPKSATVFSTSASTSASDPALSGVIPGA
jgi:hypothetical protein